MIDQGSNFYRNIFVAIFGTSGHDEINPDDCTRDNNLSCVGIIKKSKPCVQEGRPLELLLFGGLRLMFGVSDSDWYSDDINSSSSSSRSLH